MQDGKRAHALLPAAAGARPRELLMTGDGRFERGFVRRVGFRVHEGRDQRQRDVSPVRSQLYEKVDPVHTPAAHAGQSPPDAQGTCGVVSGVG